MITANRSIKQMKLYELLQCIPVSVKSYLFRDGPSEKWWGEGNFQFARIFFLLSACAGIFFRWNPLHEYFFRQMLLFFSVKSWSIHYLIVLNKLFYAYNRSNDTDNFLICVQDFFGNVLREEEAALSGRLHCAFFLNPACPLEFLYSYRSPIHIQA